MKTLGVPTVKGIGHSFKKFAWGAGGGLLFLLLYRIFGALGILAAPIIVGAVFKGEEGEDIAFLSGFLMLAIGALSGGLGTTSTSSEQTAMAV